MGAQAQAQASPASPSATGEVDGGVALDGSAVWVHEVARDGVGCLAGRSSVGRASHAVETPEQALHAGEREGKRECPAAGPYGDRVGLRCCAVRGLEQP
jgi:hypothetical protein